MINIKTQPMKKKINFRLVTRPAQNNKPSMAINTNGMEPSKSLR